MAASRKSTTSKMTKSTTGSTALTTGSITSQTMATSPIGPRISLSSSSATTAPSASQLSTSTTRPSTSSEESSPAGSSTTQLSSSTTQLSTSKTGPPQSSAGPSTSQLSTSLAGPSTSQLPTSKTGTSTSQLSTLTTGPSTSSSGPSTLQLSTSLAGTSTSSAGPSTSQLSKSLAGPSTSQLSTSKTGPSTSSSGPSTLQLLTSSAVRSTSQLSTSKTGPSTSSAGPSTSQFSTSTTGPSTSSAGPSTSQLSTSSIGPSTSSAGPSTSQLATSKTGPSTSSSGPSTLQLSTSSAVPSTSQSSTSTTGPSTSSAGPSTSQFSTSTTGPSTSSAGPSTSQLSTSSAGPSTSGSPNSSSGHMNITEEESLFLRLTYLILNIGPRAVRKMIDQRIPSSDLKQKLANETGKMQRLLQRRVINTNQWNILYPSSGTVNSKDFDMTLMIVLLREIVGVKEPSTGWNNLPRQHDQSDGARVATIKFHRNQLAHTTAGSISKTEFTKVWNNLQKAIVGIGGQGFEAEIKQLLTAPLDQSHKDLYMELKSLVHDIVVPPNIKCYQDQKIDAWDHEDKKFFPTRATNGVMEHVKNNNVTIVTGPPGSGKSATIHHIALKYKEKGYQIFYVRTVDKIFDLWVPDGKQVFLLDDPFDVHDIDKSELHRWKTFEEDMVILFNYSCMKILASVRSHIIHDQLLKFLLNKTIDITKAEMCLSNEERREIFTKHALCQNRKDLLSMSSEIESYTISCFPLLCKRFTADKEPRYSAKDFFNKPLQVIGEELNEFKNNEKIRYFCLLFCMIYDNNLDTKIIGLSCRDEKSRTIRESLLDICELPTSLSKTEIKSKLDTLLNTYLKKEGSSYQFIHDIVYDAVVDHANQLSLEAKKEVILKHCTSRFIKDRTVLSPFDINGRSDGKIVITEELEDDWGIHIINTVREGKWGDVFTNSCLQTDKADIVLARILKNLGNDCIRSFVTKRSITSKEGIVSYNFLSPLTDPIQSRLSETECSSLHLVVLCGLVNLTKVIISSVDVANENSYINLLLLACLSGKENMVTLLKEYGLNTCSMKELTPLFLSSGIGNKRIVDKLIEYGASVNIETGYLKQTPLHVAAKNGHRDIVNLLIERGADINMVDIRGLTPIDLASENGHVNVVNALIQAGFNIHNKSRFNSTSIIFDTVYGQISTRIDNCTPLHLASRQGHVDVVNALIQAGVSVDNIGNDGSTALHLASMHGHVDVVHALIQAGFNVDYIGSDGHTALHMASRFGRVDVVNALLQAGVNVDAIGSDGFTALHLASRFGHVDVVNALIQAGVNVDYIGSGGCTALHLASRYGHVVNASLQADVNADNTGSDGETALHLASRHGHVGVVNALIQAGVNVDHIGNNSDTALHLASRQGHVDVVNALLQAGVNVDNIGSDGYTALHLASRYGDVDVVNALIQAGVNVDHIGNNSDTALHLASRYGHVDVVNALLQAGVNVDVIGSDGYTAFLLASLCGHVDVVNALIHACVNVDNIDNDGFTV